MSRPATRRATPASGSSTPPLAVPVTTDCTVAIPGATVNDQLAAIELLIPATLAASVSSMAASTSLTAAARDVAGPAARTVDPSSSSSFARPPLGAQHSAAGVPGPCREFRDPAILPSDTTPRAGVHAGLDQVAPESAAVPDVSPIPSLGAGAVNNPNHVPRSSSLPWPYDPAQQHVLSAVFASMAPAASAGPAPRQQDPVPLASLSSPPAVEAAERHMNSLPTSRWPGLPSSLLTPTSMEHSLSAPSAYPQLPGARSSESTPGHALPHPDVPWHEFHLPSLPPGAYQLEFKLPAAARLNAGLDLDGCEAAASRHTSPAPSLTSNPIDHPPNLGGLAAPGRLPELGPVLLPPAGPQGSTQPADLSSAHTRPMSDLASSMALSTGLVAQAAAVDEPASDRRLPDLTAASTLAAQLGGVALPDPLSPQPSDGRVLKRRPAIDHLRPNMVPSTSLASHSSGLLVPVTLSDGVESHQTLTDPLLPDMASSVSLGLTLQPAGIPVSAPLSDYMSWSPAAGLSSLNQLSRGPSLSPGTPSMTMRGPVPALGPASCLHCGPHGPGCPSCMARTTNQSDPSPLASSNVALGPNGSPFVGLSTEPVRWDDTFGSPFTATSEPLPSPFTTRLTRLSFGTLPHETTEGPLSAPPFTAPSLEIPSGYKSDEALRITAQDQFMLRRARSSEHAPLLREHDLALFGSSPFRSAGPSEPQSLRERANPYGRPWVCSTCGRGFDRKSNLRQHVTVHSPHCRRTFRCPLCDNCFSRKHDAHRHLTKCHIQRERLSEEELNMITQEYPTFNITAAYETSPGTQAEPSP